MELPIKQEKTFVPIPAGDQPRSNGVDEIEKIELQEVPNCRVREESSEVKVNQGPGVWQKALEELTNIFQSFGVDTVAVTQKLNGKKFERDVLNQPNKFQIDRVFDMELEDFDLDFGMSMLDRMKCEICGNIPFWNGYRFLCPSGHQLCYECGMDHRVKHVGQCRIEDTLTDEVKLKGSSKDLEDAEAENSEKDEKSDFENVAVNGIGDNNKTHAIICHNEFIGYAIDPVFAAFALNAMWQCPNHAEEFCEAIVQGSDLPDHLEFCKPCAFQERDDSDKGANGVAEIDEDDQ